MLLQLLWKFKECVYERENVHRQCDTDMHIIMYLQNSDANPCFGCASFPKNSFDVDAPTHTSKIKAAKLCDDSATIKAYSTAIKDKSARSDDHSNGMCMNIKI